jgi:chromosome segregation ATPase
MKSFESERSENEKMLRDTLDKQRDANSDMSRKLERALTEVEFMSNQIKQLNPTIEEKEREIARLRLEMEKLKAAVLQYEILSKGHDNDVTNLRSELKIAKTQLEFANTEKLLLKQREERLMEQAKSDKERIEKHADLMNEMQKLSSSLDTRVSDDRSSLIKDKTRLEGEVVKLKEALDNDKLVKDAEISKLTSQAATLKEQLHETQKLLAVSKESQARSEAAASQALTASEEIKAQLRGRHPVSILEFATEL